VNAAFFCAELRCGGFPITLLMTRRGMNERRIHQIFEISVLLRGAHALIECIGGPVLTFVSTSGITSLGNALTQDEAVELVDDE
jgi:uncharacterized membrane protein